jgi:excisionase family DNA binding protein
MTRLEAAMAELIDALREEVRAEAAVASGAPDRLLSIAEAAQALHVSRTRLYGELQSGRLRSIRVGRRRLVPASTIRERIEAAPATNGNGQEVSSASSTTPTS